MMRRRPVRTRAPAAPRENFRRKRLPPEQGCFDWRPGEVAYGKTPSLGVGLATRLTALYGRSEPEGGTE
jgi:hypothetical protein